MISTKEIRVCSTTSRSITMDWLQIIKSGCLVLNFVNLVSGAHTQNIESYWNYVKIKLKQMRGTNQNMLQGYLNEFMLQERYGGNTATDCFDAIIADIADQYPL